MYRFRYLLADLPLLGATLAMVAFTVTLMVWLVQARDPQAAHAPQAPLQEEIEAAAAPAPPVVEALPALETAAETAAGAPEATVASTPEISAFETAASPQEVPAWRRFAALAPDTGGKPMVAIVIDDVGMSRKRARRAMNLDATVTLAFLPYPE